MSGGVDSSVAAALLVRAGYDVVGCFMRLGTPDEPDGTMVRADECSADSRRGGRAHGCCSAGDAADARAVAAELGIPLYACNFRRDFDRVIEYFADEYEAGRTPNPCIRCNDWLKFGRLHEYAARLGCDAVASGHYARVRRDRAGTRLLRGVDHAKDQSYVLFGVRRDRLASLLLPIGEFHKPRVREMAARFGLPVFDKPDSQEICFVPDGNYAALVERRRPALAAVGAVVTTEGEVIGEHGGHHRFTIGQRRGVGVALGRPVYVVGKDPATNTVTVGPRARLDARGCTARDANWLVEGALDGAWRPVRARHRSNSPAVPAEARAGGSGAGGEPRAFEVRFESPQFAVAPGQAVVLYDPGDPDVVLGGGWIASAT